MCERCVRVRDMSPRTLENIYTARLHESVTFPTLRLSVSHDLRHALIVAGVAALGGATRAVATTISVVATTLVELALFTADAQRRWQRGLALAPQLADGLDERCRLLRTLKEADDATPRPVRLVQGVRALCEPIYRGLWHCVSPYTEG